MTFELKFEGWIGINDTKQGEMLGAMRAGRKASVFEMQTPGAVRTEMRVERQTAARAWRALRNWKVRVVELYTLNMFLKVHFVKSSWEEAKI